MINGKQHETFPNVVSKGQLNSSAVAELEGEQFSGLHMLVVDEDHDSRERCMDLARSFHVSADYAFSIRAAQRLMATQSVDILLLDLGKPEEVGLFFLEEVHARYPETVIVIMSDSPTVDSVLRAHRQGASDLLKKPVNAEEFAEVLERSAQRRAFDTQSRALRKRLLEGTGIDRLVGRSPAMEKIYRIVSKVAFTTHPVLLLGESGTGKEVVARAIHNNGPNADKPFVAIDCGSLVPTLIESELFGHVKGAFTGATQAKPGLLAAADGGTVFLDEIGELPLDLQARLLRALQEKEIRPVGATQPVPISARILAATNRNLAEMVEHGRFRKDLYYRLNVVNIRIPPLRDRRGDILLLVEHFLDRFRRENGMDYSLGPDSMRLLTEYTWPGNVRELEHALERACALSSGPVLHVADFPSQMQGEEFYTSTSSHIAGLTGAAGDHQFEMRTIAEMEKQAILRTILQLNGDKLLAAKLLGIGKTTLYRKLKEYGIDTRGF